MKYGASLRAHSIPAWAHHNIDYDEIKAFIKENTTPGNGSAVSIPGTGDVRGKEVEDALFDILFDQHKRINLFVWSKAGEIKRRLDHLSKQTAELRLKGNTTQPRVTAKRLERYGRLEGDVLKAGEELRSLSRFITAQQTAFRKLIKKFKKWSRSAGLELSFNKEILSDSTSFTKIDLDPLLAEWEQTLDAVRALYEEHMGTSSARTPKHNNETLPNRAAVQGMFPRLREVLQSNSQARFDTFFATLPLGEGGSNAVYWVHPENVVELQVLLLQYTRSHAVRRHSTDTTPMGTLSRRTSYTASPSRRNSNSTYQDTGLLVIDNEDHFVREQSSTTLEAKESSVGMILQNASVSARWTQEGEDVICSRLLDNKNVAEIPVKREDLAAVLNTTSTVDAPKAVVATSGNGANRPEETSLRVWFASNPQYRPLATVASSRQRFTDIAGDSGGVLMVTLDKTVSMKQTSPADIGSIDSIFSNSGSTTFPYAVLRVRQEGSHASNLLRVLDNSHLVERVRGFSLEYHAIWSCCQPKDIVPPFWIPLLERDIRKLPKLTSRREATLMHSSFGSQSTTPNLSISGASDSGNGDTTAVEDPSTTGRIAIADQLQTPPLSSFKKKRRSYARVTSLMQTQKQKYWSEYDNPSDSDDDGAYVLFINPEEESGLSQTWRSLGKMFKNMSSSGDQPLSSVEEAPSSSEEESRTLVRGKTRRSYGTLENGTSLDGAVQSDQERPFWLPPITMTCLGASIAILIVGWLLAMTGRKKQAQEVDAGIIFAVVSSLLFAISGVATLFGMGKSTIWAARLIALAVLAVDAVASGALLAWILA